MHLWQSHPAWRSVLYIVGLLVVFVVILYAKVAYNARQEFALGEDAYTHGEYKRAITHYERTIKWYTPLSTVGQRALNVCGNLALRLSTRRDRIWPSKRIRSCGQSLCCAKFLHSVQGLDSQERSTYSPTPGQDQSWGRAQCRQTGARHSALYHATPTACGPASRMVDSARNRFSWLGRCDCRTDLARCG